MRQADTAVRLRAAGYLAVVVVVEGQEGLLEVDPGVLELGLHLVDVVRRPIGPQGTAVI